MSFSLSSHWKSSLKWLVAKFQLSIYSNLWSYRRNCAQTGTDFRDLKITCKEWKGRKLIFFYSFVIYIQYINSKFTNNFLEQSILIKLIIHSLSGVIFCPKLNSKTQNNSYEYKLFVSSNFSFVFSRSLSVILSFFSSTASFCSKKLKYENQPKCLSVVSVPPPPPTQIHLRSLDLRLGPSSLWREPQFRDVCGPKHERLAPTNFSKSRHCEEKMVLRYEMHPRRMSVCSLRRGWDLKSCWDDISIE